MSSLREVQSRFADGLRGDAAALDGMVLGGDFSPAERLNVYRNNYRSSLRGALADVYPVVAQLVGDGFFAFAAEGYVRAHPSRSGNLHDFGYALADHLATLEQAAGLPYLPDVARLEWAWHRAFHAADGATLALEVLAAMPAEAQARIRFDVAPSLSVLASPWPVVRIWEAHQSDAETLPAINLDECTGEHAAVLRAAGRVMVLRIPEEDHAMLSAISAGAALEAACEAALSAAPGCALADVLGRVCASGALSRAWLPEA